MNACQQDAHLRFMGSDAAQSADKNLSILDIDFTGISVSLAVKNLNRITRPQSQDVSQMMSLIGRRHGDSIANGIRGT